jgi:hypothetical protein
LLEYRDREAHDYNRGQPASGLLVWHVRPQAFDNDDEQRKRLDLVAADGLYRDAGFSAGQVDDRYAGRDNLDYWARWRRASTATGWSPDPSSRRGGWCCSNSLDSFDSTQSNAYPYWPLKSTTPHSTSRR